MNSIGGNLNIHSNPALTSLEALENLTSLGGTLGIGMFSDGSIIHIHGNPFLTSLSGLENIDAGTIDSLYITENSSLSECAITSTCDYLADSGANVQIGSNAPGCNSQAEVEDACETLSSAGNIVPEDECSLFPNPADISVTISSKNGATIEEVIIYTQTGQKVYQGKPVNQTLDISIFPPGMYIVELGSGQWKFRKKLVVD